MCLHGKQSSKGKKRIPGQERYNRSNGVAVVLHTGTETVVLLNYGKILRIIVFSVLY